jgi:hypothetical protein
MAAFDKLLREAVKHFSKFGFTSPADVNDWTTRLNAAAESALDVDTAKAKVERALAGSFTRALGRGRLQGRKGQVSKLSMDQLEPKLRGELEKRLYAAREAVDGAHRQALEKVQNRFLGLATAGAKPGAAREHAKPITKAIRDARAQERMTAVDQTMKLMRTMDEVVAADSGSIGGYWDATWDIVRKHRPEHAARHGLFYVRRGSWADSQGLVSHPEGFMDEFDMPGVLINCQCEYHYVYDLSDAPPEALTAKGRAAA